MINSIKPFQKYRIKNPAAEYNISWALDAVKRHKIPVFPSKRQHKKVDLSLEMTLGTMYNIFCGRV